MVQINGKHKTRTKSSPILSYHFAQVDLETSYKKFDEIKERD
jgi:hypothetical protein